MPSDHPYIRHLSLPSTQNEGPAPLPLQSNQQSDQHGTVVRLPDPPVRHADGQTRWWPPAMLDPTWLRHHADDFDVLHIHFGFESFAPEQLSEVCTTAHALGKGIVVTVHDLHNPHIADARVQLDRLDALIPAADEVLTLTRGAAAEISARWGRQAHVLPHPHIVDLADLDSADEPAGSSHLKAADAAQPAADFSTEHPARVSVHLKSLRANSDAAGALEALALLPPWARGVVTIHRALLDPNDPGHPREILTRARELEHQGRIDLIAHEPMSDADLHAHLRSMDASFLPYRWGTHSGWLEMCHDLGVRAVAAQVGYYAEQHNPTMYDLTYPSHLTAQEAQARGLGRINPASAASALVRALRSPRPKPATRKKRFAERVDLATAHERLYASAVRAARARS